MHQRFWWSVGMCMAGCVFCGPTQSTAVLIDADAALSAARRVDAGRVAPYEVAAAAAYLEKAQEEQSRSDFQDAVRFAERALACARAALVKAEAPVVLKGISPSCGPDPKSRPRDGAVQGLGMVETSSIGTGTATTGTSRSKEEL
ncbi:MAG: DUF4398 domain-containing protein [Myxococcota bacterium]